MAKFWDWIDSRAIVRRIVLFVTLWMTWRSFTWAAEYATVYQAGAGADMALLVGAVTAPIAALQGFVFKIYSETRNA